MAPVIRMVTAAGAVETFLDERVLGALSDYSFNEEATPLVPGDTTGATADLTITGVQRDRAHRAIDGRVELTTERGEVVRGVISQLDETSSSEIVTITADSLINRLTADVEVPPSYSVSSYQLSWRVTLRNYLRNALALVGIASSDIIVDDRIAWHAVALPGFKGSLWDYIKQLCAARGYVAYSTGSKIGFTLPNEVELDLVTGPDDSITLNTSRGDRAQNVNVINYNLKRLLNESIFIADQVYQVAAGETQEIRVTIDVSVGLVNTPQARNGITFGSLSSEYVVTGNDGYIITPALWNDAGGKLTAEIGDNYNELLITITGAALESRSPFRISEGAADRPALRLTGYGIGYTAADNLLPTGNPSAPQKQVDIDNVFIGTKAQTYDRGTLAAQRYGGSESSIQIQGQPEIRLTRRGYVNYAPSPSLLVNEQAGLGRLNSKVEGWGTLDHDGFALSYVPNVGVRVLGTITANPTNSLVWHGVPINVPSTGVAPSSILTTTGVGFDQFRKVFEWLPRSQSGRSARVTVKMIRNSGTNRLRLNVACYEMLSSSWSFMSGAASGYTAVTTGVEHTLTFNLSIPQSGGIDTYALIFFGLSAESTGLVDYTITGVAVTDDGTGAVVPTPVVVPDTVLAEPGVGTVYGYLAGSMLNYRGNRYRVRSVDYSPNGMAMQLTSWPTVKDFSDVWAGKTFAQFNSAITGMTFSQFNASPLSTSF